MKRWSLVLLAVLLVCAGLWGICQDLADPSDMCRSDVLKNASQLAALIDEYRGAFVDEAHEAHRRMDALLGLRLQYADLRNEAYAVFCLESPIVEGGRYLYYCPEDRYVIDEQHVVDSQHDALRMTGLGAGAKGYIDCIRLCAGWFFLECWLPT